MSACPQSTPNNQKQGSQTQTEGQQKTLRPLPLTARDLQELAEKILAMIKQDLLVEQERTGRPDLF